MKRFEYLSAFASSQPVADETMRRLGLDGWEAFHIEHTPGVWRFWFKRELPEGPPA